MSTSFRTPGRHGALAALHLLRLEQAGAVLHIRLNRPAKRNSVSDELLAQLHTVFVNMPKGIKAAVLSGEGDHFCAGLDLSEVTERNVFEGMHHSRAWHACFDAMQFGPVPVVAVLHGAVVGGGLELAASAHLRVAEASAFYGLPEGTRGIFVGGGGSVRISRLIGVARMTDMMLTGRVFDADEGQTFGISNYRVADGAGLWPRRWNWPPRSPATRRCPTTPSRRRCRALPTCRPATACSWKR
jgi:enoyl-CoA hydratase/carnithine racemase